MMNNKIKTVVAGVVALLALVIFGSGSSSSVFAMDNKYCSLDADPLVCSKNNIIFTAPCDSNNSSSSSSGICGTNQNYAGEQVFTDAQMEAIKANQPFYEKAAQQYGFPWQLLAVIHMREHGLARSNPSNGQGIYQFYSAAERAKCDGGDFSPGKVSDEQFQIQTNCAAKRIKESYGAGLDLSKDDDIKKMFFKYNGTAKVYKDQAIKLGFSKEQAENGEGSPYVMNRYDEKREPSSTWGQIKRDGGSIEYPANKDFGAFVYYKAITCDGSDSSSADLDSDASSATETTTTDSIDSDSTDSSSNSSASSSSSDPSCNACEKGSKNINGTAVCLAWPLGTGNERDYPDGNPTEAFQKAIDEVYPNRKWSKQTAAGASCDVFVGTVVRYAYDPEFPRGMEEQDSYVQKSDLWEVLPGNTQVQAGDVVRQSGHVLLVVQDQNGDFYSAEGHYNGKQYGGIETTVNKSGKVGGAKEIWRPTQANNSNVGVDVKNGVSTSSVTGTVSSTGQGNKDIGASALELAWPEGTSASTYQTKATDKFTEFFKTTRYKNDSGRIAGGKSCDRFVAVTIAYAGVDNEMNKKVIGDPPAQIGGVNGSGGILQHMIDSPDWEEVPSVTTPSQIDSLESGDVIVLPKHIAIYAKDSSGKGYVVHASEGTRFGAAFDAHGNGGVNYASSIRAFRNKNNKSSGSGSCNACPINGDEDAGAGSLKEGGMTKEEAKKFMEAYAKEADKKKRGSYSFDGAYIHDANCPNGTLNNCVAFSQWFFNRYTTKGPKWSNTTNGVGLAKKIASTFNLKTGSGSQPRPYAIFSKSGPSSAGHTGVILGVDTNSKKVITGEAACNQSSGKYTRPWVGEYSFNDIKGWNYVYLDEVWGGGGGGSW